MREGICWWVGAGASGWNVVLGAAEPAPLACRATRSRAGMRCADEGRFRYQKVQRRKTSAVTGNGYFDSEPMPFKACPRLGGRRYPTLGWGGGAKLLSSTWPHGTWRRGGTWHSVAANFSGSELAFSKQTTRIVAHPSGEPRAQAAQTPALVHQPGIASCKGTELSKYTLYYI